MAKGQVAKSGKKGKAPTGKDSGKSKKKFSKGGKSGKKDGGKKGKLQGKSAKAAEKKAAGKKVAAAGAKPAETKTEPASKLHELSRKDRRTARRSNKDNADLREAAIKLWEKLRRRDLTDETRPRVLSDLGSLIKGHISKLITKHDTARVVESYLKFGRHAERDLVFKELSGQWVRLVQSKYAKFAVKRIFKYGSKVQRATIMKSFYGYTRRLIKNKDSASVLENAYVMHANADQRAALIGEFYGPQYSLTKGAETRPLAVVLEEDPSKKQSIIEHLKDSLVPLAEKRPMQHSLVHKVLLDFFTYATGEIRSEMIETVREALVHILHTREGAQVTMNCLWHGTAKDRKVIVKTFKSFVPKICMEEYGHGVMLAVFDTVDDTVLVSKALISEMAESLEELTADRFGRKVLYYILDSRASSQCHPSMVDLLRHGDGNSSSKKTPEMRCTELRTAISPSLLEHCATHAVEMARDKPQSQLLVASTEHCIGDIRPVMETLAEAAAEDFDEDHIVADDSGHFCVKKVILQDKSRPDGPHFSTTLLEKLDEGFALKWSQTNRGAFVVSSLLECGVDEAASRVRSELKSHMPKLRKLETPGAKVLCKLLEKGAG